MCRQLCYSLTDTPINTTMVISKLYFRGKVYKGFMDASYQVLPSQQTALLETTVAKMREFGFGGKIEDQISWETNKNKFIKNTFYDQLDWFIG